MDDQAQEQSTEERMMAYLEAEDGLEDEEAPAAEEEQEEQTAPEEETPEARTLRLKRGEEEIEIPEAEAIELAQKGYDYTKKTQALAEERKAVEERAQAIQAQEQRLTQQFQAQQALIKDVAKIEALSDQIAQYEALDWNGLSDSDPVQAQKLFFQWQQLQAKRAHAVNEYQGKHQQYQSAQQQHTAQQIAEGMKQLTKEIPDWGDAKRQQVREAGMSYGFSDGELSGVTDPRMIRVLHDAMLYRAMQQAKPAMEKKVADKPPVVKPGGKDAKVAAKSQNTALRDRLKKTGDQHIAAKLIEQML